MKYKLKLSVYLILATLVLAVGCKSPEEPKVDFPENELPVSTTSDEALTAYLTGLELYDRGEIMKARPYFREAVELDPNFVSGHMYVAYTSNSAKNWAENRARFLSMRDQANEAEKLMMDALEASMANDTQKELEANRALMEKYPNSPRPVDYMAGYYMGRDQVEKAREYMKKALEMDPNYIPAIANLGNSYLFTSPKDYDQAEKYMKMFVEKAPESATAHIAMGDWHRSQTNLQQALDSYQKAIQLDTQNEVAHSKAGHANTFLGNYEQARENFRDAREVSEFGAGGFNWEAYTYLYEGDHEKALAFLQESVEKCDQMDMPDSNKNSVKMNLTSNCAAIAMHYDDADHLKTLVAKMKPMSEQFSADVNNPVTTSYQMANMHYWDAMVSVIEGDYEAAAAKAEEIKSTMANVDVPNKDRQFHRVHAMVNMKQGNYEKALEHLAQLNEDDVYVQYLMAKAYKMSGDEAKATELFDEIVDNNFNSVWYALILAEARDMVASTS